LRLLLDNIYLAGNNPWDNPIDLLYCVLKEDPPYTDIKEFIQDLDALFNIVTDDPNLEQIHYLAMQLWLGEMTWREFVVDLMRNHLRLRHAASSTSEEKSM
jgi:hypothetical protein